MRLSEDFSKVRFTLDLLWGPSAESKVFNFGIIILKSLLESLLEETGKAGESDLQGDSNTSSSPDSPPSSSFSSSSAFFSSGLADYYVGRLKRDLPV